MWEASTGYLSDTWDDECYIGNKSKEESVCFRIKWECLKCDNYKIMKLCVTRAQFNWVRVYCVKVNQYDACCL